MQATVVVEFEKQSEEMRPMVGMVVVDLKIRSE